MRTSNRRIILPQENEILDKLSGADVQTGDCPRYSSVWMDKHLNAEILQERYGEYWDKQPIDVKDYYRAQGVRDAVRAAVDILVWKNKKPASGAHEIIPQELEEEWKEIIQKVVCHHLAEKMDIQEIADET